MVEEIVDECKAHPKTREKVREYVRKVKAFQREYEQQGFAEGDKQVMTKLINLVIESYNLMWHLRVYKLGFPVLLNDIREGRATFQKLRHLHGSRRKMQLKLLGKGVKATEVRPAVFQMLITSEGMGEMLAIAIGKEVCALIRK